jgi:YD repeat-containing protein
MNRFSTLLSFVIAVVCLSAGMTALGATPPTIDSFPYQPNESAQASDFEANYGSGPTAAGSTWTNGTLTGSRCGTGGTGVQAWAVLHNANYANDTTTWLHSPFFDFSSDSGLELRFELWVKTHIGVSKADGMKLQVSTNGGSSWSDVTTQTVAYTSTVSALSTAFGGSSNGWGSTTLGGGSATTCAVDLNTWYGQSDVRFRWCFASDNDRVDNGVVIDSIRVVPVVASVGYSSGYVAVPQGSAVGATITKSGGSAFTSGMTVSFGGSGVTGTVSSVTNADVCSVTFTASRTADVASQMFYINLSGGTRVCEGVVTVFYPQQLISNRQGSSAQEPALNGTMGGNGVYLHNGEFRHDLPILSIPGRMLPLSVGLTYRSRLDTIGPVGAGWSVSFDNRLTYSSGGDDITLYSGSGRIDTFELESGGTAGEGPYVLPGFFLELWRDDNGSSGDVTDDVFTIKYAHGSLATFEPVHQDTANQQVFRQTSFEDRYGNTISYEYNGSGQLVRMLGDLYDAGTSTERYALDFEYGDDGRLFKITDHADFTGQQSVIGSSYTGNREWEFIYNSDARLTEIKLPKTERYYSNTKGSTYRSRVQFTYDSNDNLLEVIDARQANETSPYGWLKNNYASDKVTYQDVGRSSSGDSTHRQYIVYDSGTDVSVVNAEQHRSQYLLNGDGTLDEVKHYTGTWDTDATVLSATPAHSGDPSYFSTQYEYDSEFHVIQVTFPRGNYTKFRYDIGSGEQRSRGNLLRVLSHRGSLSSSTVPSNQANGLLAKFTYTSAAQFNLLATSVGPRGFELASNYDITTHTNITNDWSADFTTTNTYYFSHGTYPDGTLQKTTTPDVDTTHSPGTLNNGQVLETEFTYNAFGQVLSAEDDAGVDTLYAYGSSGFGKGYLASVSVGSSSPLVTEFTYNSVGRAITVEDPNGEVWTTFVNQLDQGIKSQTPQVSAQTGTGSAATYYTETDYDLNGNVEKSRFSNIDEEGDPISPSEPETTYAYNILDLVTSITEPIESGVTRTTSFAYDLIFRTIETTLPEGNRTATDYDELNRAFKSYAGFNVTNVAKASALIKSEVFYDANSNVIESIDGRSNDSDFTYDAYDRPIKAEDRLNSNRGYTTYTYNQAGQVTETVRKGKKNIFIPAGGGGPYFQVNNDEELAKAETRYDNIGRAYFSRTRARNSDDDANLGYSSYQGSGSTDGWSQSTVLFRSNGQVEQTYGDLGYGTKYEYDSYNRLARIIDDRDGGGASTGDDDNYDEYTYDANGNVTAVTAHLYDDVGSSGNKTLTTGFAYDEINRLIEDTSPDLGGSTFLTREFKYDSRGNLVISIDRKDQMRRTSYDLLSRPIRHIVDGVTQRTIDGAGLIDTDVRDIVSRTVYNKNSDVTQSIDPNGNRTYFKYDLAQRWLQTQHADGGTGTPLKTTAGTTHSISQVGSSAYYSGTSTYDGNSNLLNLIDENDTTFTWTYDENDNVLTETGATAGGNPFEIEGETGLSYTYDGLYRAIYGETHDASDTLTETDSVFDSLSGLELQEQRVHVAHPNDPTYSRSGAVASKFDESGRRFQRTNPGELTRTTWDFDTKHRPTDTWLEYNSGGWGSPALISQYKYLGGGLLHSQQIKYVKETTGTYANSVFPIISDFEHDNLLRVTSVRHWRDDFLVTPGNYRLLGRYDYAYDENSMMRYEARWHEDDDDGTSTTPEETDFYFYDKRNQLEKAVYNATKYGASSGTGITLSNIGTAEGHFGDDTDNQGTYSDRVYYARRKTPTRESVNWYRGTPLRTSSTITQDDTATGPTQKTNYATSDDPGADPDTPASDGEGSRHNYTVIGQVGHTYDKNRNVLADGTREFRYNYKNQLRHVWRKSDGDDEATGLISKYREDAFGRRVYAESHWELSRRVYLDTRFELDIDVDADNDSTVIDYVDGGITSDDIPGPGDTDQRTLWDSFVRRAPGIPDEAWYFDFLVDVPEAGEGEYLGYVSYDIYELRIFEDGYELWNTSGTPTMLGSDAASPAGRRNIGIRAEYGTETEEGVWVDGVQIITADLALTAPPVNVGFGTHGLGSGEDHPPGLILLENLNYIKSYVRGVPEDESGGGGGGGRPVVTITNFDGPRPVTVTQLTVPPESEREEKVNCNSTEDGTRMDRINEEGDMVAHLYLPNGRRATGVVVAPSMCILTYSEGTPSELEDVVPGVAILLTTDAVGTHTPYLRVAPAFPIVTPLTESESDSLVCAGIYNLQCIITSHGTAEPAAGSSAPGDGGGGGGGDVPSVVTGLGGPPAVSKGNGHSQTDPGTCACRQGDPSNNQQAAGRTSEHTGNEHDHNDGDEHNRHDDVEVCSGPEWNGKAMPGSDGNWYVDIGGKIYRVKNAGLTRWEDESIMDIGEWDCASGMYKNLEEVDTDTQESSWWDAVQYGLGVLSGIVGEISDTISGILDALGAFIDDPIGFIDEMLAGLGALVDAIAAGDAMGVLEQTLPGVAGFIKTHLMEGSEGVSMGAKGEALGRMIVEIAGMFGGGGGGAGAKLIKAIADMVGDVAGVGVAVQKAAKTAAACFAEGTQVWVLKDGVDPEDAEEALRTGHNWQDYFELVPIEEVKAGDWVLSRDESGDSARLRLSTVAFTTSRLVDEVLDLTILDPLTRAVSTIRTTPGHPFWTWAHEGETIQIADTRPHETEGLHYRTTTSGALLTAEEGWAFAADLCIGQVVNGAYNPAGYVVRSEAVSAPLTRVYNFAVEGTQTYFVSSPDGNESATPIWVHNNNGDKRPGKAHKNSQPGHTPAKDHQNPARRKAAQDERNKKAADAKAAEAIIEAEIKAAWDALSPKAKGCFGRGDAGFAEFRKKELEKRNKKD